MLIACTWKAVRGGRPIELDTNNAIHRGTFQLAVFIDYSPQDRIAHISLFYAISNLFLDIKAGSWV
jgi:hypothetical protein